MLLSREAILTARDRKYDTVAVPEWGGDVKLASMTAAERLDYEALAARVDKGEKIDLLVHMLATCAVDDEGRKLFRPDDVAALQDKHPAILFRLFRSAAALNALTPETVAALEKN